ncbi:hypothetical protein M427DRAFT_72628 [Gonapodya prolifera JEL478]|uniref:Phox-like protein n=1 Tax=Gonapodya prolifera (strain JEL478) TaxID=1344416 RepID=A0A139A5T4_GONPJ|nr:hypothetical protein M427DRAFT_72628 [Gonapodya prolifera JEL478]|eukprot:KXS11723.1 hypothetical protein M427DRAFT_72628 [Gonapodya prolifera JEL478]
MAALLSSPLSSPVSSVSIPSLSLNPQPRPHHVFHVLVAGPVRSWTVKRRYSDFYALFSRLTSAMPADAPPVPFPPKTANVGQAVSSLLGKSATEDREFLEARRAQLEAWLRAVLATSPAWRDSQEWADFLQIPERAGRTPVSLFAAGQSPSTSSVASTAPPPYPGPPSAVSAPTLSLNTPSPSSAPPPATQSPLDSRAWIDEHDRLRSLAREIRGIAAARPSSGTAGANPSDARAHRLLAAYQTGLDRLEESLKAEQRGMSEGRSATPGADARSGKAGLKSAEPVKPPSTSLSPGEISRRWDLLDTLRSDLPSLTRLSSTGQQTPSTPRQADSTRRAQLLNNSTPSPSASSKRRFGSDAAALETPETRGVATADLVGMQTQAMAAQDTSLAGLAGVVRRQRELAGAIGEELEVHNRLLGEMGGDVERTGGRLKKAGKRLEKIVK